MPKNPILEELYAVRSQIQTEHGDHLSAFLHSEFERLKAEGHPVAEVEQRQPRCAEAAKASGVTDDSQPSPFSDR